MQRQLVKRAKLVVCINFLLVVLDTHSVFLGQIVIYDCVRKVLKKTGVKAKDIDILVINCSLFSPTPSLCSMVINEFKMRSDIASYNLSGMVRNICNCAIHPTFPDEVNLSIGVTLSSIHRDVLLVLYQWSLLKTFLQEDLIVKRWLFRPKISPRTCILEMSVGFCCKTLCLDAVSIFESLNVTGGFQDFIIQNKYLFLSGGAAILMSNKWTDGYRASFKLLNVVRTQYVSEDSFGAVYETEDAQCQRGVRLSKDIVKVAGRAMEKNFTTLGPYVLPVSEQLKTGFWMLARFLAKKAELVNLKVGPGFLQLLLLVKSLV